MSRFTHLGRVGRRSLGAVLLLACLTVVTSATVSAQEDHTITINVSEPFQRDNSSEPALTQSSGVQAAEWCRSMTATFTHRGQYSVSSKTKWCWDNTIVTYRRIFNPQFERHGVQYFVWGIVTRPTSNPGKWYAEDLTSWNAQKCTGTVGVRGRKPGVGIECDDEERHWLRKTQYNNGEYDHHHWET